MTDEPNSVLNTVKEAFAPVTDALKNFQNLEVPEAAREFLKKDPRGSAKERAADLHAGSEKVTAAIETAVFRFGHRSRQDQPQHPDALYQDAEGVLRGHRQAGSAKSLNEAVQIQSDLLRSRGEVLVSRAKASTEYLGKLVADGAKTAQDNLTKVYSKTADRGPRTNCYVEGPLRRAFFFGDVTSICALTRGPIFSVIPGRAQRRSGISRLRVRASHAPD